MSEEDKGIIEDKIMNEDLTVSPFYHSAVNEVTKPSSDSVLVPDFRDSQGQSRAT